MKKSILLLILFTVITLTSCGKKETSFTPEEAKEYLEKVRQTYGSENIFNSTISFSRKDLDYIVERKDHILNSSLRRIFKGVNYFTTYENGHIEYFINDTLQDDKTYKRKFLDVQLDGFVYTTFIPQVFNGNDILVNRLKDVIIDNYTYNTLHVTSKPVEGLETDEFYLYIDPETYYIAFLAQKHELTAPIPVFKKFYNFRNVNEILFADYYSFRSEKNDVPLDSLYIKYNDASLQELSTIKYSKIDVKINQ